MSVISGDCVFGDKQGAVFSNGTNCSTTIGSSNRLCYREDVQSLCCASCNALYRPVQSRWHPVRDGFVANNNDSNSNNNSYT